MIVATDGDIVLRYLTTDDIPVMARLANNKKIAMNLRDAFPYPYSLEDAWRFFNMVEKMNPQTFFAIEYKGEYAGNISLMKGSDIYRNSAEIGYFIGEPFWNKGIMTKAVNLITEFGFNELGVVRIFTGVFSYNLASQRVLEKCGYIKEAVFKDSITKDGQIWDEIRYARLKAK
ncbi:MAG TPA: GNAT family protein [Lentimicrobium sp.]|nr:GNAT family protein [Lentimicrobium sp.]